MGIESFLPCKLVAVTDLKKAVAADKQFDTICVVDGDQVPSLLSSAFKTTKAFDEAFESEVSCFKCTDLNCRVIYSPIGQLSDFDDVRRYNQAAAKLICRTIKAGAKSPILVLPSNDKFENADLVTLLGVCENLYVPIQLREDVPTKKQRFSMLGVYSENEKHLTGLLELVKKLEAGRFISRDIGGGDPEYMAPPKVADYIQLVFGKSSVIKTEIISDPVIFEKEYPLFQAVNRAAGSVKRHQGRIIFLEYKPPAPAKKTLFLVGKGVTYDTGGADIKAGGIMAGMSRDKCGAAAVAGFMKVVEENQPKDVHVVGVLCMVRNSVGEECYVSDEIITSRAGVRVRVGNTDAEGRMCMADALCKMKERVINERLPDPHLFTVATLTGHACLAVGNCSIVMDNGPARQSGHGSKLQSEGEKIGDIFEISVLKKEDFDFHSGKCYGEDVLQCNNLPSSRTPRGHQGPAAFMMLSTGLDKCGLKSPYPIKYSHLDIAGSAGEITEIPTGAPILALAKTHLL
uniref:Putative leucyl aminopeptidase n=1 Tax=Corethrella appendiculata TaxID=1370023 RepID=U5EVA5_9DIPT